METAVMKYKIDELPSDAITSFRGEFFFLSNYFMPSPVEMYGITFPSVEHAFAAAKLDPNGGVHDRDTVMRKMMEIAACPKPNDAKRMGRARFLAGNPFMRPDWDAIKHKLVATLVTRKFEDHPVLRDKLLATGDRLLIEGNDWGDKIWGAIEKDGFLIGQNMLGRILMELRTQLRKTAA